MRSTRRSLTSRDLMIAVVAFALSLKLGLAYSRSPAYWREANFQGEAAEAFRFYAGQIDKGQFGAPWFPPDERKSAAVRARQFADESDRRRTRYLRAAFLPWLPNAPEPPST